MQAGRELDAKVTETLGWKEAIDEGWYRMLGRPKRVSP
ncbi:hypothetical protein DES34_101723 [Brevibacillus brevis]|nr:hypothetical protein DES34_101723 [Brevibacillus brevis]VEF88837.1 Uncharacterised protein [Brevibacillus brevis]